MEKTNKHRGKEERESLKKYTRKEPIGENIPKEIKEIPHWVCWYPKPRKKKEGEIEITKPPISPKTGRMTDVASANLNKEEWGTFEEAKQFLMNHTHVKIGQTTYPVCGVGFVLTKELNLVGIDLDDCINSHGLSKEAKEILTKFDSYGEISPSGHGVRILLRGVKPGDLCKGGDGNFLEMYDSFRYITFTGQHLETTPRTIEPRQAQINEIYCKYLDQPKVSQSEPTATSIASISDEELLEKARNAHNGAKFSSLWSGHWEGLYNSQSEAELAMCSILAFWTNKDANRMDNLLRQSGLYRKKWDSKHGTFTYGAVTIDKAIATVKNTYKEKKHRREGKEQKKAKGDTEKTRPKFNPINEAKAFRQKGHFIFIWEQIRKYKDGWYQVEDDRVLLAQIAKQINEDFDGRLPKSNEVLETLKNLLAEECQKIKLPETQYINCKNGILNLDTMELSQHTPEMYFTNQIAANYDLDALKEMQIWPNFLKDILVKKDTQQPDDSLANVVQEFSGYCLYRGIPFHKAIMLYGGGSNGKSKLVGVLEQLFSDVTSHVHFEEIGIDVFSTSDLAGTLLNISPEISANACLRDGHVKGIISGDKIRGQRKFQPAFDFKPIAKHIITTNNLPRSNDKSFGFFRRFMIIPFWQTFYTKEEIEALPDTEKNLAKVEDPFIDTKLESELDAIFTWAVMGLKRLMEHKAFTKSEQIDEMNRLFQIRSRSVEEWADERLDTTDVTQSVLVQVAYRDYIEFCKRLGVPPVANRKFTSELRNLGFLVEKGTQGQIFIRGGKLN